MKKNIKKICISTVVSMFLSIIFVLLLLQKDFNISNIGRIIFYGGVFDFIAFHFMFGFKKLYDYIVEKRFIIAIILIIVSSVVGIMINIENNNLTECIINTELIFSLGWNIKFYALLLSSYELVLLITGDNKYLSVAGSTIITFSSCIVYNFTKIDSVILGSIIVSLLNKLFCIESKKKRFINIAMIILCSIVYSYTFIPYAVSFGYVFIGLIIFVIIKNKDKIKDQKGELICVLLMSILGIVISKILIKNNYTEEFQETIAGYSLIFSYLYGILLPFKDIPYKEVWASMCGIAPVPLVIALYYLYKKEQHVSFLMPISVVTVFEIVYCFMGFPNFLSKAFLLENVSTYRMMTAIQFANLLLIFYFIGVIKERLFSVKVNMRITVLFLIIVAFVSFPKDISNRLYLILYICELTTLVFLFLNMEEKNYRKGLVAVLVLISILSSVPVTFLI